MAQQVTFLEFSKKITSDVLKRMTSLWLVLRGKTILNCVAPSAHSSVKRSTICRDQFYFYLIPLDMFVAMCTEKIYSK